jgi:hypothetical protein
MKEKIVVIIFLVSITLSAQPERRYFDTPFGGGGGYSAGWYMPDLAPVNQKLSLIGVPDLSTSGVFSSGGAGFLYLGVIPNLRIGGMGFGGSTSKNTSAAGVNREVRYSFGGGGFTAEYTLPFIKRIGVSIGAIIGAASQSLEIYKNSGTFSWDDVWSGIGGNESTADYSRVMENNYWILSPTLNIDIPFYRFFVFRIGAGYNFSLGNEWEVENNMSLSGVPEDLNGDGFFIQSGIFIGFFSF